jgi:LytR cell envelope-related transcriptional attenuator
VDLPTSLPREYPWRTTAMIAAGLAAFELVLLVMLSLAFLARPLLGGGGEERSTSRPAAAAPAPEAEVAAAPTARPKARPTLARDATTVIVLNGNGSPGAAGDKADLVRTRGYIIAGTANAPRTDFARSVVMFRPGYRAEAVRLARDFKLTRVTPLDGLRPADLQGAHVALIVGAS